MAGSNSTFLGVDRDGDDWIAVGYSNQDTFGVTRFESIQNLWEDFGDQAKRIVVDAPIGLCDSLEVPDPKGIVSEDELSRHCDTLARKVIGDRHPSVFTPPCRAAAELAADGEPYEKVNQRNKDRTGKGLTQQAAHIAPGIVEIDTLLRNGGDPETLVEGHPEVCFRALSDENLKHSKKSAPGVDERLSLLESTVEYDCEVWRKLAKELAEEGYTVGLDDLLDALVLTLTAIAPDDELQTLPRDPPIDSKGLPMQMVYRRERPFRICRE